MKAFLILAAICVFALLLPNFGRAFLDKCEKRCASLANHRWVTAIIVAFVMLFSAALTMFYRLPQPRIHDEFSYLLQSDTFANGRLANPTHPLWKYFETFHVLQRPHYVSKYQPGQGLFLALGQVVRQPIFGVWISTALAIAALFWMLRALFSPPWALAGATLAFLNAQVLWWNWSFWGGSVPVLAGALVLGGMFRAIQEPTPVAGIGMGVGAGLLVITRPFEGAVLCSIVGLICVWSFNKKSWRRFGQLIAPFLCGVLPFVAFDAYYNYRVTGNALTPPYSIYEKTYSRNALFIWQRDPQNNRDHRPEINRFYDDEKRDSDMQRSFGGFVRGIWPKLKLYDRYFLHGLLALTVIAALLMVRKPELKLCLGIFMVCLAVTLCSSFWAQPHYSAPILPLFIAIVLYGFQSLHGIARSRLLARLSFVAFCLLGLAMFTARLWKDQKIQWQYNRADLVAQLNRLPNKQLVLVRYSSGHNPKTEWIYNAADIDHAHVVFAPDGDAEYLKPLLTYFKGYDVTHIEPDKPMWGN